MAAEAAALADLLKDDLDDDFVYEEVEVMRCVSPYSSLSRHSHAVLHLTVTMEIMMLRVRIWTLLSAACRHSPTRQAHALIVPLHS